MRQVGSHRAQRPSVAWEVCLKHQPCAPLPVHPDASKSPRKKLFHESQRICDSRFALFDFQWRLSLPCAEESKIEKRKSGISNRFQVQTYMDPDNHEFVR